MEHITRIRTKPLVRLLLSKEFFSLSLEKEKVGIGDMREECMGDVHEHELKPDLTRLLGSRLLVNRVKHVTGSGSFAEP